MSEIPVLSESPSKAEIVAWYAAAEKFVNDLMAAKDREKVTKKKLAKQSNPRVCG